MISSSYSTESSKTEQYNNYWQSHIYTKSCFSSLKRTLRANTVSDNPYLSIKSRQMLQLLSFLVSSMGPPKEFQGLLFPQRFMIEGCLQLDLRFASHSFLQTGKFIYRGGKIIKIRAQIRRQPFSSPDESLFNIINDSGSNFKWRKERTCYLFLKCPKNRPNGRFLEHWKVGRGHWLVAGVWGSR